jgi:hypothetical protein
VRGRGKQDGIIDNLEVLIRQAAQALQILTNDYGRNYELLKQYYRMLYAEEDELMAIPLMMDIYFMFAPAARGDGLRSAKKELPVGDDPEAEFKEWFDEMTETVISEGARGDKAEASSISGTMNAIYEEVVHPEEAEDDMKGSKTLMTPGFKNEIKDCIEFEKNYHGKVFPFLAVDPRRKNIMKLIEDGSRFTGRPGPLVSSNGPFYGIKLYPRLGYLPKDLDVGSIGLYEWCNKYDIPICVHCNPSGFPFWNDKWKEKGHPKEWKDILKRFGDPSIGTGLRIDFAHFASRKSEWRAQVLDYINNGSEYGHNIFTDISCFTKRKDLVKAKLEYEKPENAALRGKLMFGTDYDIMVVTGFFKDIQSYFERYREVFENDTDPSYTRELMVDAPRAFLKL